MTPDARLEKYQHDGAPPGCSRLECLSFGSELRYAVPGRFIAVLSDYSVFWRKAPAQVLHFALGKIISLPCAEFLLVPNNRNHVISFAMNADGIVNNIYVNINMTPESDGDRWTWRDLELDLRVVPCGESSWTVALLDEDEFEAANLPQRERAIAIEEVKRVSNAIAERVFPFQLPSVPWLGFDQSVLKGQQ